MSCTPLVFAIWIIWRLRKSKIYHTLDELNLLHNKFVMFNFILQCTDTYNHFSQGTTMFDESCNVSLPASYVKSKIFLRLRLTQPKINQHCIPGWGFDSVYAKSKHQLLQDKEIFNYNLIRVSYYTTHTFNSYLIILVAIEY